MPARRHRHNRHDLSFDIHIDSSAPKEHMMEHGELVDPLEAVSSSVAETAPKDPMKNKKGRPSLALEDESQHDSALAASGNVPAIEVQAATIMDQDIAPSTQATEDEPRASFQSQPEPARVENTHGAREHARSAACVIPRPAAVEDDDDENGPSFVASKPSEACQVNSHEAHYEAGMPNVATKDAEHEASDEQPAEAGMPHVAAEDAEHEASDEQAEWMGKSHDDFSAMDEPSTQPLDLSLLDDAADSVTEHDFTSVTEDDGYLTDGQVSMDDSVLGRASVMSSASPNSHRRTSRRTEALIEAAARDIVEHIQVKRGFVRSSIESDAEAAGGDARRGRDWSVTSRSLASRDSTQTVPTDEGGDSSSHHEADDDVFSDKSPRSSMGSMDEAEQAKIEQTLFQRNITQRARTPRMSDIPCADGHGDFISTRRGTPRMPFRSPSSVMALQMSSPTVSALGTPRSSRRTPLPTVSRLGSPSVSAQYSPKRTPPRFRRATPPLVLLHVTLLPLRWSWAAVLDAAQPSHLSAEAKSLQEAWRQLQDRTGDTVSDRGILLPHPQNDYEVLEERLLEALELPLRRRARILECGHYLGPANDMFPHDEADGDGEHDDGLSSRRASLDALHWCGTCRSDIRYDSLGRGKVFRVKVYASNGLMRAGAWEACWKEMERVDVEIEPVVDAKLQDELSYLASEQERELQMREAMDEEPFDEDDDEEREDGDEEREDDDDEGRARSHEWRRESVAEFQHGDEQRMRELYGHSPPSPSRFASAPSASAAPECTVRAAAPSPSRVDKSASLPQLLVEAARVMMQDKKNVMIGLLSLLVLLLALRGAGPRRGPLPYETTATAPERAVVVAMPEAVFGERMIKAEAVAGANSASPTTAASEACEPCLPSPSGTVVAAAVDGAATETVTETVLATVKETMLETA
ncbi:hypothetical protein DCS_08200 [Drechmeria coniospora]|uniref:Pathway-specific nitrogen regulator n=1 Tax=Drechmeria coniospora TaxID=98403 RepID=A0A151GGS5_DRECN|nr:hypothetical protein DCS_08200 [Drechmeria coniospora]KYK56231.1 hypothetical protein DCS_08200 [Drechmeria coniospora]